MRNETGSEPGQLTSVTNALHILRMLKTEPSLRVTDVAHRLAVSASTAHRLLNTMRQLGFVEQEPRGRAYRAGWELVEMGLEGSGRLEIRDHLRPVLEALRDEYDETCNLLVSEGRYVRFIDGLESRNPVRVATRTGQRIEAHGAAAGKVLLAERSVAYVRSLYEDDGLTAMTSATITRLDSFIQELALVRRQGYASNLGEHVSDLHAVGVKVADGVGHVVAALTLSAPANRLRKGDVRSIAVRLMLASATLTRLTWPSAAAINSG
jgi:DNA-binding IclR family transcriptional regulator